ncbi:hypothetical protein [Streptomyces sp. NPDC059949]|uniref:hypothetical protein n=1 Tax=Streptomyces sp. NPDC059949 TaxID=3347013 RepID=UPI003664CCE6
MPSTNFHSQLVEEQLLAALHDAINECARHPGSCTGDHVSARLVNQLSAGLLREATAAQAPCGPGGLDVDALIQTAYEVTAPIAKQDALIRFTPGLAASGLAHVEHLDIRAAVALKHRVDLKFSCGFTSADGGASWSLTLTEVDRGWLASAKTMTAPVKKRVTALVDDPKHRAGLAPVIEAARHVAGMRALSNLRVARAGLASAGSRTVAARAVFDRYGYNTADLDRLRSALAQLAAADGKGLVGW